MSESFYTYKYPHPSVTTDCVVFGYDGKRLGLLLIERGGEPYRGCWALPGGFLQMDETVEEGAARELLEETGVKDICLEQFHVFSAVNRDPRERILSVAFLALVRKSDCRVIAGDDAARAEWFDVDKLPSLAFDHQEIIKTAWERLQELSGFRPVVFRLLDKKFTLDELQHLYEMIGRREYDRCCFRKEILASGLLVACDGGEVQDGVSQLYSFDEELYACRKVLRIPEMFPMVF